MTAQDFFRFRTPNFEKLRLYGFSEQGAEWVYTTEILGGDFTLTVHISRNGAVKTSLIDAFSGDPYTLHLVEEAEGAFVGSVREAFAGVLREISEKCFEKEVFSLEQTKALLVHAREKYGDEAEYLWEKFPDCAVLRRSDSEKWYAVVLTVQRKKLGLAGEGTTEILDVRMDPVELALLVDGKRYFPGWHMNKKHWLAVPLDGTLPTDELFELLEGSWQLAK